MHHETEPTSPPRDNPNMTPSEAAEYLKLAQLGCRNPLQTMAYLVKKKKIQHVKIAGRVAFRREHLDAYVLRHDPHVAKAGRMEKGLAP